MARRFPAVTLRRRGCKVVPARWGRVLGTPAGPADREVMR